jgi:glycosyltransferase involved in cell wall biosynthesis
MNIAFDARWLGRTGIGRYTDELLDQLQAQDKTNHYYVLLTPQTFAQWKPVNPNFHPIVCEYEVYSWKEQLKLATLLRDLKVDLVHFTNFNHPIAYNRPFIITIHDLTLLHYQNVREESGGKTMYRLKQIAMKRVLKHALKRAKTILVPTKFVRDELTDLYPNARNRILVTYEAANSRLPEAEAIPGVTLPASFMLYVGNYYPYKNVGRLIDAFARSQSHIQGVKLVLTGANDEFQQRFRLQAEQLGLLDDVLFVGRVTDGQLVDLYQKASLLVQPSLSEGFGLPGLESMRYGTPVLAARATCLPEIYGNAAAYFNPLSISDITDKIDDILSDGQTRHDLHAAGLERVKQYSWVTMAQQTLMAYTEATRPQAVATTPVPTPPPSPKA